MERNNLGSGDIPEILAILQALEKIYGKMVGPWVPPINRFPKVYPIQLNVFDIPPDVWGAVGNYLGMRWGGLSWITDRTMQDGALQL